MQHGQPAPEFTLPDLDGRIHMLSDYRGRIVIVNFWSADCPHCERTDTSTLACLPRWGQGIALLTIASNDNEPDGMVAGIARRRGLPVVLRDAGHSVADRYEALTTPHVFVTDRLGILRYRGAVDDVTFRQHEATRSFLQEAVEALLGGSLPELAETQPFGCTIVRYP
ncbi:MAG: redoxin domain-containing protein [Chloroflexota bacterium]